MVALVLVQVPVAFANMLVGMVIGCFAYLVVSLTSLLFPAYASTVSPLKFLAIGEILIILWLLIMGARTEPLEAQPSK